MPAHPTFAAQVDRLFELGHDDLAGLPASDFRSALEPARAAIDAAPASTPENAFGALLVVTGDLVPSTPRIPQLRVVDRGRAGSTPGVLDRNHGPEGIDPYRPEPDCAPPAIAYALLDIDRGDEFRGVAPEQATDTIRARGRSPLTIDEGIALLTQAPEFLVRNHCFMLAGSRRGDRRVPALWISGTAVKLGWCWAGNPHDWLGVASAGARVAA